MNIDSSNILSLLSGDSLEKIQQTMQVDEGVSQEFADTLLDKIRQLTGLDVADYLPENFMSGEGTMQHELAGLLNEGGAAEDFTPLIGKDLPIANRLEKDINLENTFEALANVMNTLEDVSLEQENLETKIEFLLEKSEAIRASIPEQTELEEKLGEIVDELKTDDNLELTNQIAAIVTALNEPQEKEKMTVVPVIGEPVAEQKKEASSMKQMAEERALGIAPKSESETLLQQENGSRKPGQDNPAIVAKQNEKIDFLDADIRKPEPGNEKALPRFATDIANLNRAVMHENKAEPAPMTKHFAHPEWNKEIAERVVWMHKQEIPSAELRLNPRHLGPISIRVDVTQDQVTVAFTAQHAAVKEAIEVALPKLREMFSAQQLNLAEVNVSQDDTGQRQARSFAHMGGNPDKNGQKDNDETGSNEQAEKVMNMTDEIEAGRAIASNGILSIFA